MPGEKFLHGNQSRAVVKIGKNTKFAPHNPDNDSLPPFQSKKEKHAKSTAFPSSFKTESEGAGKKKTRPRTWVDLLAARDNNRIEPALHAPGSMKSTTAYIKDLTNIQPKENEYNNLVGQEWQDTDSSATGGAPSSTVSVLGSDTSSSSAAGLIPGLAPFPPRSSAKKQPSPDIQNTQNTQNSAKTEDMLGRPLSPVSRAYQDHMLYSTSNRPLYLMPFPLINTSESSMGERFRVENHLRAFVMRENRLRELASERVAEARGSE
jgi:hypothetical protein